MNQIIDGLWIGDADAASDPKSLQSLGITHILRVMSSENYPPIFKDSFVYKIIPVIDIPTANLISYFDNAHDFIDKVVKSKYGKVLVHCYSGISRSASIVIAYMLQQNPEAKLQKIVDFVRSKRKKTNPNPGFLD